MLSNKVLRSGVAPEVVLTNAQAAESATEGAARPKASAYAEGHIQPMASSRFKGFVKSVLRRLVPYVRPVATRTRAYLLHPAMQQLGGTLEAQSVQLAAIRNSVTQMQQSTALLRQAVSELRQVASEQRQAEEELSGRMRVVEDYSFASARRVAIPGRHGEVLVRTAVGYVLCAADDHALLAILLEAGELEPGVRLLIERTLRPGDVFVDVGANVGMHTVAAARAVQRQGRVIAFEPSETTARLLARTVWLNGFEGLVDVRQAAVSSHGGVQDLHIGRTSGHNSLFQLPENDSAGLPPMRVQLVTIDEVLPAGSRVDLFKVDVEGAELDVLQGSTRALADNPDAGLIVEFGRSHLQRTGQTTADWLAAFHRLGLEHRMVDAVTGALVAVTEEQLTTTESANLLFARPAAGIWARAGGEA